MAARILAICISDKGGIPKYEHPYAKIGEFGLMGDFHNRPERPSFSKPGTLKPNIDRQVSLVAHEVLMEMNELLGSEMEEPLVCGSLGENLTVDGLGDLSALPVGTRLKVGEYLVLRVTEHNNPCKNLAPLHRLLVKHIYGKRGLLCAIEEGVGSCIFTDDKIEILSLGEDIKGAA